MLCKCHSGIQKRGGNPGNLTRLNGFRVHSIYMIRFPPRQNRIKIVYVVFFSIAILIDKIKYYYLIYMFIGAYMAISEF